MSELLAKSKHDFIRYANCWEDADVLVKAMDVKPTDRVLSIGSAGDNSFSLLCGKPEALVAVDINHAQLMLIALKKAAFQVLNYDEFLVFLGFAASKNRLELFEKVKQALPAEIAEYWQNNSEAIKKGIIYQGKFEKYFELFRSKILTLIHSKKKINALFAPKSDAEQLIFFEKEWNTWRWKALFKIFFSKAVMGRFGRDPEFLKEVKVPVATSIKAKADAHLSLAVCQKNYFLHFIMHGNFGSRLPHYAREENFETIKSQLHKLTVFEGFAQEVSVQEGRFTKFNLSNIFEYMPDEVFANTAKSLADLAAPGARFAYWNLMVPRMMSETTSTLKNVKDAAAHDFGVDNGFFYGRFVLDEKL